MLVTHHVTSFELQVYISTVEAKEYPILGLQWHPEKNNFEWTKHKNIPHGYWASEITHQVRTCSVLIE
jgi:gamma-glutamyl hydrolase